PLSVRHPWADPVLVHVGRAQPGRDRGGGAGGHPPDHRLLLPDRLLREPAGAVPGGGQLLRRCPPLRRKRDPGGAGDRPGDPAGEVLCAGPGVGQADSDLPGGVRGQHVPPGPLGDAGRLIARTPGYRPSTSFGGRSSYGIDSTTVVRVVTLAADRICCSSRSRSGGLATRTSRRYESSPATE